jgi:protein-tyrosine-phosphatase
VINADLGGAEIVLRWLRKALRNALHLIDRILHPLRRRRARRTLERVGPVRSILFICHGNICRSPYAAVAYRQRLPGSLRGAYTIDSAGFIGPDRPSPPLALSVAARRGVDLSAHRSALLSREKIANASVVVVMSRVQKKAIQKEFRRAPDSILILGDLDQSPIRTRTITDPYSQTEDIFETSFTRIDRCLEQLTSLLAPRL